MATPVPFKPRRRLGHFKLKSRALSKRGFSPNFTKFGCLEAYGWQGIHGEEGLGQSHYTRDAQRSSCACRDADWPVVDAGDGAGADGGGYGHGVSAVYTACQRVYGFRSTSPTRLPRSQMRDLGHPILTTAQIPRSTTPLQLRQSVTNRQSGCGLLTGAYLGGRALANAGIEAQALLDVL